MNIPSAVPPLREVAEYLREFKDKLQFFGFIIVDRDKNSSKTLLKLGINGDNVRSCLRELEPTDYFQGPTPNEQAGNPPVWVFGRELRGHEIYIKVHLGRPSRSVICISFHLAEHSITYPLKRKPHSLPPTDDSA
ncbi:type II toxin-antitoxin system MqsR family toxin [Hymenobacter lapidarius]|uniref:type II toxin-antitoxin system MqsR family toxin n=1 Tax=Hymenobacter lapidarius TaxID=1908237 RepID=UPI000AC25DEE|nr:type II toxin-antitoxin system MqsR family toxin [Hymenobacter lapidarius]